MDTRVPKRGKTQSERDKGGEAPMNCRHFVLKWQRKNNALCLSGNLAESCFDKESTTHAECMLAQRSRKRAGQDHVSNVIVWFSDACVSAVHFKQTPNESLHLATIVL